MTVVVTLGIDLGLDVTPLACLSLDGHLSLLLFWMIAPLVVIVLLLAVAAVTAANAYAREDEHELCTSSATFTASTFTFDAAATRAPSFSILT